MKHFEPTDEAKRAFARVLIHIRAQADCANWDDFVGKALLEIGQELSASTLERIAPTPKYAGMPNAGLMYTLGQWGVFTFPNGELITTDSLIDVLMGVRDANGDRINGQPSQRHGSRR